MQSLLTQNCIWCRSEVGGEEVSHLDSCPASLPDHRREKILAGDPFFLPFVLTACGLGLTVTALARPAQFLPLLITIASPIVILWKLKHAPEYLKRTSGGILLKGTDWVPLARPDGEALSWKLIAENATLGATVGAIFALLLESFLLESNSVFVNVGNGMTSIYLAIGFYLCVVVAVGGSEELAKILSSCRLEMPGGTSYFGMTRKVARDRDYILLSVASAAGFAFVEALKYVFVVGSIRRETASSVERALIAIPFHMALTGIVAADSVGRRREGKQYFIRATASSLVVPAFLHGTYDAGLMLINNMPATLSDDSLPIWRGFCLSSAIVAFFTTFLIFFQKWRTVECG